ncbi:PREDICTED: lipoma HMGIC fusion partner-like 4 protein, partial [Tauraco erythrolophus]|uniref:lipoma HMGIC fusion partner-like 4 protein n=1 Tax=Tauraco erythrolophus TaxID=121530 RepID=UPI000523B3C8
VRNSRAIGVLWAIFTICFAIINVVVFIQPYWVGDSVNTPKPGYFGLFHYCVGSGLAGRELAGRGADAGCTHALTGKLSARHCHPRAPSDVSPSSPLQPSAALCLVLGCMIFPDGWDAETIRDMCGEKTGKYSLGDCSVRWAYILAIIGILNALILSFLAFVLGNRQNDLLHEELKTESKDFVGTA